MRIGNMELIPHFATLSDATKYLQTKFNRTDFTCTEIPYQQNDGVVFCVCTDSMEYQTASVEFDNDSMSFVFDDMRGNQILCNGLDELFSKSMEYQKSFVFK
jgi:hypothetical protein